MKLRTHHVSPGDKIEMVDIGQRFECIGLINFAPGKQLTAWWAPCADCGRVFIITVSRKGEFKPNRRCRKCQRPGVPVKRRKEQ